MKKRPAAEVAVLAALLVADGLLLPRPKAAARPKDPEGVFSLRLDDGSEIREVSWPEVVEYVLSRGLGLQGKEVTKDGVRVGFLSGGQKGA